MNRFGVGEQPSYEQHYERACHSLLQYAKVATGAERRYWYSMLYRTMHELTIAFETKYALQRCDLTKGTNESSFALSGLKLAASGLIRSDTLSFSGETIPYEVEDYDQDVSIIYAGLKPDIFQLDQEDEAEEVEFISDVFAVGLDFDRMVNRQEGARFCYVPLDGLVVRNRVIFE